MDFPYGDIVDPPQGFAPPEAWEEFGAVANPQEFCAREEVGENPKGIRWSLWPLTFEEYISDTEPDMEKSRSGTLARNRLVTWKRIARTDIPKGWRQLSNKTWRIDGFHTLEGPDYQKKWGRKARRKAQLWLEHHSGITHSIEEIPFEEYRDVFKKSRAQSRAGDIFMPALSRMPAAIIKNYRFWGARNLSTGEIEAGTAALYSISRKASMYRVPFFLPQAAHLPVMPGLIDHWFRHALENGIRTQIFTIFWYPGKPKRWKGFSQFKSHFGLQYVAYPPELFRFVRGKVY